MKRTRFTEEQIIGVLKEAEAGAKAADLAREHGISEATFYCSATIRLRSASNRPPRAGSPPDRYPTGALEMMAMMGYFCDCAVGIAALVAHATALWALITL